MSLETYKEVIHEGFSKEADLIDKIIKRLKLNKNAKILDIGTGMGAMSILLAINGYKVITGQPEHNPEWEEMKKQHYEHDHATGHGHHHG